MRMRKQTFFLKNSGTCFCLNLTQKSNFSDKKWRFSTQFLNRKQKFLLCPPQKKLFSWSDTTHDTGYIGLDKDKKQVIFFRILPKLRFFRNKFFWLKPVREFKTENIFVFKDGKVRKLFVFFFRYSAKFFQKVANFLKMFYVSFLIFSCTVVLGILCTSLV